MAALWRYREFVYVSDFIYWFILMHLYVAWNTNVNLKQCNNVNLKLIISNNPSNTVVTTM